jgi:hypothetical protein
MAEVTTNPLQQTSPSPSPSPSSDKARESAADVSEPRVPGPPEEEGRVNIKDVLLDSQAHSGVNSMCITLVVIYIYFKFLGELTSDQFAKNNVQIVRPRAAAAQPVASTS